MLNTWRPTGCSPFGSQSFREHSRERMQVGVGSSTNQLNE